MHTDITIMEPGNDYPVANLLNYRMIRRQKGFMRSTLVKVAITCTVGCALVYNAQAWKPLKEPWRIDKALKSTERHILRPVTHDPKALVKLAVIVAVSTYCPPVAEGAISMGGVAAAGAANAGCDKLLYGASDRQMFQSFVIGSGGALITAYTLNFPGGNYAQFVQGGVANIGLRIASDYVFYGNTSLKGRNLSASLAVAFVPAFDMGNKYLEAFTYGASKSFVKQAVQNRLNLKKVNFGRTIEGGTLEMRNAFVTQQVSELTKSTIAKFENNTQTDSTNNKKSDANKKVTAKTGKSMNKRPLNNWNKSDIAKANKNAFGTTGSSKDVWASKSSDLSKNLAFLGKNPGSSQGNFDFGHHVTFESKLGINFAQDLVSGVDFARNLLVSTASLEASFGESLLMGTVATAPISAFQGFLTYKETGSKAKGVARTICNIGGTFVGTAAATLAGGGTLLVTKHPVATKTVAVSVNTFTSTAASTVCYKLSEELIDGTLYEPEVDRLENGLTWPIGSKF